MKNTVQRNERKRICDCTQIRNDLGILPYHRTQTSCVYFLQYSYVHSFLEVRKRNAEKKEMAYVGAHFFC